MWETVCTIDELRRETLPENLLAFRKWLDEQISKIPCEYQEHAEFTVLDTTHCGSHYSMYIISYPVEEEAN